MCTLVLSLLAAGCATTSDPTVVEYFDELTVTSISRSTETVDFVSRRPGISTLGGDMITMGPVYATLSAEHNLYLWLGFWTTLDRFQLQSAPPAPPEQIEISLDDEVLKLERVVLSRYSGPDAHRIYPSPSPGVVDTYYAITLEQIDRIRAAESIEIRVPGANGVVAVYVPRDDAAPMLAAFIEFTG